MKKYLTEYTKDCAFEKNLNFALMRKEADPPLVDFVKESWKSLEVVPNIKIGDGSAYLIDNPFITSSVEQLIQLHITDTVKHITEQERNNWNSKVRCYLSSEDNENIIFTTN